jgi:hypothetical protein
MKPRYTLIFSLQETEVFGVPRQVVEDAQPDLARLLVGAYGVND